MARDVDQPTHGTKFTRVSDSVADGRGDALEPNYGKSMALRVSGVLIDVVNS